MNMNVGADAGRETETKPAKKSGFASPALSMANTVKNTIKTRKIAILAGDGVDEASLNAMKKALTNEGAIVAWSRRMAASSKARTAARFASSISLLNAASVLFDAVYIPGGAKSVDALKANAKTIHFVNEMYKHCKAIAATGEGVDLDSRFLHPIAPDQGKEPGNDPALIVEEKSDANKISEKFIKAIAQHRNWDREKTAKETIPA